MKDIFIRNGTVLPLVAGRTDLITPGFVSIKDGVIDDVGPMADAPGASPFAQVIDAEGSLVMPGLVNSHTHGAMTLFRGLADDLPFMVWLQEHIFPAEANHVNPEMVYWCTKLAAAEMILSGATTVADSYFHEDYAARAFRDTGLRAVAAQGVIDFPAPGVPDPSYNVDAAATFIDQWQEKNSLITPAVFCHSPYTCGPATLQKAKELSQQRKVPFFIHVAETEEENREVRERFGTTPVRHLHSLEILDRNTICVHCVWLTRKDIEIIKQTGAHVATCPESNMKLASGVAPLMDLLAEGIPVGIGTDGCSSNNDLDLFREMDTLAKLHKVTHHDPTILPARTVLQMATIGGAGMLGMDHLIGSIAKGKKADIIFLDLNQPHLTPFYNTDLLVYAARGADVSTVIIDGNLVMQDRVIFTFDLAETMARVRELSKEIQ